MSKQQWKLTWFKSPEYLWIDPGRFVGVQGGLSPIEPFMNVGKGSSFTVPVYMEAYYFKQNKRPGGDVSGTLTDDSSKAQPGLILDFLYGGAPATTATDGPST